MIFAVRVVNGDFDWACITELDVRIGAEAGTVPELDDVNGTAAVDADECNAWNGVGVALRFVSVWGMGIWSVLTTVIVDETVSLLADWSDGIGVIGSGCFMSTERSSRKARRPSLASSFGTWPRSRQRQSAFWYEKSLNSSWLIALTITASIGVKTTGMFVKSLSKLLVSRGLTWRASPAFASTNNRLRINLPLSVWTVAWFVDAPRLPNRFCPRRMRDVWSPLHRLEQQHSPVVSLGSWS